jgi:hypothetical protein
MAVNLRSPYYVEMEDSDMVYSILKLYIWTGPLEDIPSIPQYTLRKNVITGQTENYYEISELIRDYLDLTFNNTYGDNQCVYFKYDIRAYDINGTEIVSDEITSFAFDSYSYFEENRFDVEDNPLMISNRQIFALADNLVRVPINTKNNPTITFLKDGVVVGTYSYNSSPDTEDQIKYITLSGTTDSDSYIDRILNDGGVYEANKCIVAFLDEYEIGEIDEIRVSDDNVELETIKVKTLEECKYSPKKVTFINKFGALQDMYFFKKAVEKMTVKKETYKSNILSGRTYNRTHHVNREFNVVGRESVTLSSGFLSEEYNEVFKQMMLSEKVWITNIIETGEQVLPINVKTSNITYKTSLNDRLVEYTFDFDNSFDTINNIR